MAQYTAQGQYPAYLTASGVVAKATARLVRIVVTTLIGATGVTFYDNTAASGNVVFVVPAAAPVGTIYYLDWPCYIGIYASFGSTGGLAISFNDGVS